MLQQKLQQRLPDIKCSADMATCTHMLVVLDAGDRGDAQADSCALNHKGYRQDILEGMQRGMKPIILHVGAVPFEAYMWSKGTALWQSRLFDTIAIPAPEAVLLAAAAPGAAREEPELEAIALGRVGLKICADAPAAGHRRVVDRVLQAGVLLTSSAASAGKMFAHKTAGSVQKRAPAHTKVTGNPMHVGGASAAPPSAAPGRASLGWSTFAGADGEVTTAINPLAKHRGAGAANPACANGLKVGGSAADALSTAPSLPVGWAAAVDPSSGSPYYHHEATGEARWEMPTDSEDSGLKI